MVKKIKKYIEKKYQKEKEKEKEKEKRKKKKSLLSVVLDKMCVFCLYPIPNSQ